MPKKKDNSSLLSILKGEFIAYENNQKYALYILMLVVLILINISSSFRAENLLKESISLKKEVTELRLTYITTKSDLMNLYKRSVVEDLVEGQGLKTSLVKPIIINMSDE
tara:strand:- start:451 stop:780 length:330 start_codon:yes stop_codon:yes gene_type:complete